LSIIAAGVFVDIVVHTREFADPVPRRFAAEEDE